MTKVQNFIIKLFTATTTKKEKLKIKFLKFSLSFVVEKVNLLDEVSQKTFNLNVIYRLLVT